MPHGERGSMSGDLEDLISRINSFRDDRDWRQFHNPKDLALSVVLEASELLELFQWRSAEQVVESRSQGLRDEIADVLIYTLMLADDLGCDPADLVRDKLRLNAQKYPVDRSRGTNVKYSDLR